MISAHEGKQENFALPPVLILASSVVLDKELSLLLQGTQ